MMSVPLSNTAIRSCPMFPSLPASGSMCTCVKPRAAFFFMRGSGRGVGGWARAGGRCHQREVWSWAEDEVQEASQNLGSSESRSRAHWSPGRGWDGGLVAACSSHCYPNSAGDEAGVVRQGKVGSGHQGKGTGPFLAASMGPCLDPCPNPPAPRG